MIFETPESMIEKSEMLMTEANVDLDSCLEMKQLTHFLSKLRYFTDDTLNTNLNDSEKPSLEYRLKRCDYVIKNDLFPVWEMRDNILKQCSYELEKYKKKLDISHPDVSTLKTPLIMNIGNDNRLENLDPYKKRDLIKKTTVAYGDYNASKKWLEQQLGVEKILKERSVSILRTQCNEFVDFQALYHKSRK